MPNVPAYVKTNWQNLPNKTTAVNATNLNHIETAIYNLTQFVNTLTNTLAGLTDTTISNPSNNQLLKYNGSKWINATIEFVTTLAELTDTTISNPANGQFLRYNGSKWINATVDLVDTLSDLTDTTIASPSAGDYLKFNGSTWINEAINLVTTLAALTDTEITNPSSGDYLKFDGSKWVNDSGAAISGDIDDLDNVVVNNPTNGQVLKYNSISGDWVNSDESGGMIFDLDEYVRPGQRLEYDYNNKWTNSRILPPDIELIMFNILFERVFIFKNSVSQATTINIPTINDTDSGLTATFEVDGTIVINGTNNTEYDAIIDTHNSIIPLPVITSVKCGGYLKGAYAPYLHHIDISGESIDFRMEFDSNYRHNAYDYGRSRLTGDTYTQDLDIDGKIKLPGYTEGSDISVEFTRSSDVGFVINLPKGTYTAVRLLPQIIYKK